MLHIHNLTFTIKQNYMWPEYLCRDNKSMLLLVILLKMHLFCVVLSNLQGIHAMGFKRAQGNEHCAK